MSLDISTEQATLLKKSLQHWLPDTSVWAFGSRVTGKARSTSDLDLVIFSQPSQTANVAALREALEESMLPFRVDLLVWDEIPEDFKKNIQRAYTIII